MSLPKGILGLVLAPLIAASIVLSGVVATLWGGVLRLWFWYAHRRHGRHVLFVYSNSPNWQGYIEENLLPRVRHQAVVLNWSERGSWRRTHWWAAQAFAWWAGTREFNPIAIVFVDRFEVITIRFFQAFREHKNGQPEALRAAEEELGGWLNP